MSNAIKYTQRGLVQIEAEVLDPSTFQIAVRDTGVGIEPGRLRDLFTAFTKIQRYRELNSDGCGLGLTISKKMAIAMGGDITVQSIVGTGSVFTVRLPLRKRVVHQGVSQFDSEDNNPIDSNRGMFPRLYQSTDDMQEGVFTRAERYSKYEK